MKILIKICYWHLSFLLTQRKREEKTCFFFFDLHIDIERKREKSKRRLDKEMIKIWSLLCGNSSEEIHVVVTWVGLVWRIWSEKRWGAARNIMILKRGEGRGRTVYLHVPDHLAKFWGLFFELSIFLENLVMVFWDMVEFVYELVVLIPEPHDLRPKLIKVLLLPHPRPTCGFSGWYHSPVLPLVDESELVFISLIRGGVAADAWWLRAEIIGGGVVVVAI